jgi:DNA ligase-1
VAHRLMGDWEPSPAFFESLHATDSADADISRPYPFLPGPRAGGRPRDARRRSGWQAEWKWTASAAQLIRAAGGPSSVARRGACHRTHPELAAVGDCSRGTVLDGRPAVEEGALCPSRRCRAIGRKTRRQDDPRRGPRGALLTTCSRDGGLGRPPSRLYPATCPAGGCCRGGGLARRQIVSPHRQASSGGAGRGEASAAPAAEGLMSQAARLPLRGRQASAATGGSGRSTRSPSTPS